MTMNHYQKTRSVFLEIINAGYKNSALRMSPHDAELAASRLATVQEFPLDGGPSVGIGGMTVEQWLVQQKTERPQDFEGAGANVNNNDNKGGGGAESLLEKSARITGMSIEEFNKKDPMFKHAAADEAQGDTGYIWHGEIKTPAFAGKDAKTIASMSLEDRLLEANAAYFRAAEARKPGAKR